MEFQNSCQLLNKVCGDFERTNANAMAIDDYSFESTTSTIWLILHLLVSFTLVAKMRWSRVVIHNHACNTRELPACCCQHSQVEPCSNTEVKSEEDDKKRDLVEKRIDVTKEDELSVPTLALSRETNHTESARLQKLRIEYARYLQMLKVGLPRVIVDHKLQDEDKDPDVLDELIRTVPHVKRLSAPLQIPPVEDMIENDNLQSMQNVESF